MNTEEKFFDAGFRNQSNCHICGMHMNTMVMHPMCGKSNSLIPVASNESVDFLCPYNLPPYNMPLPIPNKEREAAEAVLKEFKEHFNSDNRHTNVIYLSNIEYFLNQKYPTNG